MNRNVLDDPKRRTNYLVSRDLFENLMLIEDGDFLYILSFYKDHKKYNDTNALLVFFLQTLPCKVIKFYQSHTTYSSSHDIHLFSCFFYLQMTKKCPQVILLWIAQPP